MQHDVLYATFVKTPFKVAPAVARLVAALQAEA